MKIVGYIAICLLILAGQVSGSPFTAEAKPNDIVDGEGSTIKINYTQPTWNNGDGTRTKLATIEDIDTLLDMIAELEERVVELEEQIKEIRDNYIDTRDLPAEEIDPWVPVLEPCTAEYLLNELNKQEE